MQPDVDDALQIIHGLLDDLPPGFQWWILLLQLCGICFGSSMEEFGLGPVTALHTSFDLFCEALSYAPGACNAGAASNCRITVLGKAYCTRPLVYLITIQFLRSASMAQCLPNSLTALTIFSAYPQSCDKKVSWQASCIRPMRWAEHKTDIGLATATSSF